MNNIDIAKGIIFQKLHISKDTFDDRLICQKKIYLLQQLDVDLGYDYNWYIHGPYCSTLTNYLYLNIDMLRGYDFSGYKLVDKVTEKISVINSLIDKKPKELHEASWYELLASLLYIQVNKNNWKVSDEESLFQCLMKYKPQFNLDECRQALGVLNRYQFISNEGGDESVRR